MSEADLVADDRRSRVIRSIANRSIATGNGRLATLSRSASEGGGAVLGGAAGKRATSTLSAVRARTRAPPTTSSAGDRSNATLLSASQTPLSSAIAIRLAAIWNGTNPSIPSTETASPGPLAASPSAAEPVLPALGLQHPEPAGRERHQQRRGNPQPAKPPPQHVQRATHQKACPRLI